MIIHQLFNHVTDPVEPEPSQKRHLKGALCVWGPASALVLTRSTHPELVFGSVDPQFLQSDGQVVHTDPSVPVHVQDLEQNLQPVVLVQTATHLTRWIFVVLRGSGSRRGLCGPALAEHPAQHAGKNRTLRVDHVPRGSWFGGRFRSDRTDTTSPHHMAEPTRTGG